MIVNALFIIGNGFDIDHGLKTSYEDFHNYLKEQFPNAKPSYDIPEYMIDNHGNNIPANEDSIVGFIRQILDDTDGSKWSDLELAVGNIDFKTYLPDYKFDEEDEDDEWDEVYFNEDFAINMKNALLDIPLYFEQWIQSITYKNLTPKKRFVKILKKADNNLFLNFNYTRTLEEVYKVHRVCHIHGVQGRKLLFGHGVKRDYFSDDIYGRVPGTEEYFQSIHDGLRKDTDNAFKHHDKFFCNLNSDIGKIYSYGLSFSEVDRIYIEKICSRIDTRGIIWYLNDFDSRKIREEYKYIIRKCGFKGKFRIYSTNYPILRLLNKLRKK